MNRLDSPLVVRGSGVDHVDQQRGAGQLFERRVECADEIGRKIANEPDRVGDDDFAFARESKLETDRRRVRERAARLEKELTRLGTQRKNRRRRRQRRDVPVLSIVGYTNAGKSTLLRALTESDVHIEDKMFATLDPVSRRLRFPREREVIITDTVGFIRDLPEELVAAFRATLEELADASLLLHVVDVSAPDLERRMTTVRKILDGLGLADASELLVFNQADRLPPDEAKAIAARFGGVAVSALTREGLTELLKSAERLLFSNESRAAARRRAEDLAATGG